MILSPLYQPLVSGHIQRVYNEGRLHGVGGTAVDNVVVAALGLVESLLDAGLALIGLGTTSEAVGGIGDGLLDLLLGGLGEVRSQLLLGLYEVVSELITDCWNDAGRAYW